MPELPEVETVRRGLASQVTGRAVARVRIFPDRVPLVRGTTPEAFAAALAGRRLECVERRGKYLLFRLSGGLWWIAHLRMTGSVRLRRPEEPPDPHLRAVLTLDDGRELRWADVRKFGTWQLAEDPDAALPSLGPDALDAGRFTLEHLRRAAVRRRTPVKSFLLDQTVVAGLGNIYADEVLHAARVPPDRLAAALSEAELERLWRAIPAVLERALAHGGTSFRDFVDSSGVLGRYLEVAWVHRRAGHPCPVCGGPVASGRIGGRSTYWCPRCQAG
ncbi:MAG TPA: bifunctional DNA-formamidopyrimidine glycosylase/DNA-(apurinic or apyrimidinic site) lyase [Dehalococcoidia bacterium]